MCKQANFLVHIQVGATSSKQISVNTSTVHSFEFFMTSIMLLNLRPTTSLHLHGEYSISLIKLNTYNIAHQQHVLYFNTFGSLEIA